MKYLIIALLVFNVNILSQWQKAYSPKVEEFMMIVEDKYQNLKNVEDDILLEADELDFIVKKMYYAIEDDPKGYEKYIYNKQNVWKNSLKEKKIDELTPKFTHALKLIYDKIKDKYSKEYLRILRIPYFLKVKIIKKTKEEYTDIDNYTDNQTVLVCNIEEVIKGKCNFHVGESITLKYLDHLTQFRKNDFEIGKSYLIPIRVSIYENSNYEGYLVQFLEDFNTSYLIENQIIRVPGNYFQISEEMNWVEFKNKFINKYLFNN